MHREYYYIIIEIIIEEPAIYAYQEIKRGRMPRDSGHRNLGSWPRTYEPVRRSYLVDRWALTLALWIQRIWRVFPKFVFGVNDWQPGHRKWRSETGFIDHRPTYIETLYDSSGIQTESFFYFHFLERHEESWQVKQFLPKSSLPCLIMKLTVLALPSLSQCL